jgi:two-component system chemotaxis response regulator CheB
MFGNPISVLVVDDSAVVRQVISHILASDGMHVTVAPDPIIAGEKIERSQPDVVVLDLEMPRMNGITFLRKLMKETPLPVVICSGAAQRGTEVALTALQEGALEVVAKPKIGVKEYLHEAAVVLIDAVRAAAAAKPTISLKRRSSPAVQKPVRVNHGPNKAGGCIAIGASTGGTEAILDFLQQMKVDCPGIVVVQHMPEKFTAAFARRLNEVCEIEVREAKTGDAIRTGLALIAPGNRHMELVKTATGYAVRICDGPLVSRHRPSVDVLFRSVSKAAGKHAVGVIMTGMGNDGAQGLAAMRASGAFTIAQDESTSVVFGMPKEAIDQGGVCSILPLGSIPDATTSYFSK